MKHPGFWIVIGVLATFVADWALFVHYRIIP